MATFTHRTQASAAGTTWKAEYYGQSTANLFELLDSGNFVIRQIFYGDNLNGWSSSGHITGIDYFDSSGNLTSSVRGLDLTMGKYNSLLTIGTGSQAFQQYIRSGNDQVKGSKFSDNLMGSDGVDTIDGGAGSDTISYRYYTSSITVNLDKGTATPFSGSTKLLSIENVEGSQYGDKLTGSNGANTFQGFAGDDVIDGKGGVDTAVYRESSSAVVVDLTSGAVTGGAGRDTLISIENVVGSRFNDTLTGSSAKNTFDGFLGDDTIDGKGGFDTIDYGFAVRAVTVNLATGVVNGGAGADTLKSIEAVKGSVFGDKITGSAVANTILGDEGNDTLKGAGGNDTIGGGDGSDKLYGGDGSDILTGGAGKDTFVFDTKLAKNNIDTVTDFRVVDDIIYLQNAIFSALTGLKTLSADQFHSSTAGAANDKSDRIIYETDTGKLFYDADGKGGAAGVQFAQLSAKLGLTASDIYII